MKRTFPVKTSAAVTVTGQSAAYATVQGRGVACLVNVTAVSGTTPNMVISLQWSNDGNTWYDGDPVDQMTAFTTTGAKTKDFIARGQFVRVVWTITGTTPSFTFTADIFTIW